MNVLLLGAGASKAYSDSLTKIKMPVAKDFFKTFNQLDISSNPWVLIGDLLNYLKHYHNIPWTGFINYNEDIEVLHSEVEEKLFQLLQNNVNIFEEYESLLVYKTYLQLSFIFSSVINEIQNGLVSKPHLALAQMLNETDTVITFNWDTLMDKALSISSSWNTDSGYFVKPVKVYKDEWCSISEINTNHPLILKLHGSTNWITSCYRPGNGKLVPLQETPIDDFYIYEYASNPYATYNGRYMEGYNNFSYGYYPPNLPLFGEKIPDGYVLLNATITHNDMPKGKSESKGLFSMPLIVPPVKRKNYAYFGDIFKTLWKKAEESITQASRIIVIGYSFPVTDTQTDLLFTAAFSKRSDMPLIIIVDPNPERIVERFISTYGITQDKIIVYKEYFDESFNCNVLFN